MAKEKNFSISEAIGFAWETFKKNWLLLVALAAINFIVGAPDYKNYNNENISTGVSILSWFLRMLVELGTITIVLKLIDKKKTDLGDFFKNIKLYWRFLGVNILYALIVIAGLILLIIPGIIWALKYQFAGYLVVDKGMRPVEALRKSAEITSGVKWDLLGLAISMLAIIILGAIALVIGLFVAIPMTWLALVYVYRKLEKQVN